MGIKKGREEPQTGGGPGCCGPEIAAKVKAFAAGPGGCCSGEMAKSMKDLCGSLFGAEQGKSVQEGGPDGS